MDHEAKKISVPDPPMVFSGGSFPLSPWARAARKQVQDIEAWTLPLLQ